jgi:predicted metal-dependent hydrolase
MTDADAKLISTRLENLEGLIERIEGLIQREISDLKSEQIADLRRENERLADDQRRLWEAVRTLETDRNRAHGGAKVISGLITFVVSIAGSSVAATVITKLLR